MNDTLSRDMLDLLPFGIGYLKPLADKPGDYVVLDVNAAFEALTGLRRSDVAGMPASEIFQEKSRGSFHWLLYFDSVLRSGRMQTTTQWIESFCRRLHITVIPSGRELLAFVIRDVAADSPSLWRGGADEVSFQDLQAMLHHTHDAVSLVEFQDNEFRYVCNNAVHKRITGFSDVEGLSSLEVFGEEDGKRFQQAFAICVDTGRPVIFERKFNFAPGGQIWQTEITPIYANDMIRYLRCSSKDISELKKARGENEGLTRRLHAMFNQHSAVMMIFDPASGRIIDANPAACDFYGYSNAEFRELRVHDISMVSGDQLSAKFRSVFQGNNYFSVVPHRLKSGEIRLVDIYSCALSDGDSRLLYAIIFDATDREHYRNELIREKEMLRTTLHSIGDGVVTTDNHGFITSLNSVGQAITGWDGGSALGRPFGEVFALQNEDSGQPMEGPVEAVLRTGRTEGLSHNTALLNRQGQAIPISHSAAPIRASDDTIFGVVMVFRDVSMEREYGRRIRLLSDHDSLTGLYNRRFAEEALHGFNTRDNLPLAVIMCDVNGLKLTNDVFGLETGDALLRQVAELLTRSCRKGDLAARWGSDEFVILMPRTGLQDAEKLIERMKNADLSLDEGGLPMSLSLGCAIKTTIDQSILAVVAEAEENMHHQKLLDGKSYRNAVINTLLATLYEKSMETEEHSKRLEANCHRIGQVFELSSKSMDALSLLAILHDIGKVGINPDILKKSGPLTSAEWEEMKRHPEIGYRIVQSAPELAGVAELILSHHERWDGKGYPRELRGNDIPLVCRILSVTDAYDAMTNSRSYRSALSREHAILELERNAGTQFDPEIVKVFLQVLRTEQ